MINNLFKDLINPVVVFGKKKKRKKEETNVDLPVDQGPIGSST